jgi:hypothetical protein
MAGIHPKFRLRLARQCRSTVLRHFGGARRTQCRGIGNRRNSARLCACAAAVEARRVA